MLGRRKQGIQASKGFENPEAKIKQVLIFLPFFSLFFFKKGVHWSKKQQQKLTKCINNYVWL